MKHHFATIILLFTAGLAFAHAEKRHIVVFEATVVRIDTWGLVKFTCGVAIHHRLAEYRVDHIEHGSLRPGERIVVRHVACNWNELDDLKVGDKVIVLAQRLRRSEKISWQGKLDSTRGAPEDGKDGEINLPLTSEPVSVQYNAKTVAKVIYPSKSDSYLPNQLGFTKSSSAIPETCMSTTITSEGQATVPKHIRDSFDLPLDAGFVAGNTHALSHQQGGSKAGVLPEFLIAAHEQAEGANFLPRDPAATVSTSPRGA